MKKAGQADKNAQVQRDEVPTVEQIVHNFGVNNPSIGTTHCNEHKPIAMTDVERKLAKSLKPPDGGWGWIVVAGSFIMRLIVLGLLFSFGVILIGLMEDFNGRSETAWVYSIMAALPEICAPLASAFVNSHGCRNTAIIGSFIAASGFFASQFAPSLWFLYISFGFISGIGIGLMYLPSVIIVSYYFEEHRALAAGIANCGSGVGMFIMAPVISELMAEFGWRICCGYLAGVILQGMVIAGVFRPLPLINNTEDISTLENISCKACERKSVVGAVKVSDRELNPEASGKKGSNHGSTPICSVLHNSRSLPAKVYESIGLAEINYERNLKTVYGMMWDKGDIAQQVAFSRSAVRNSNNLTCIAARTSTAALRSSTAALCSSKKPADKPKSATDTQLYRVMGRKDTFARSINRLKEDSGFHLLLHRPLHRKDVFYTSSLTNFKLFRSDQIGYTRSNMAIGEYLHQISSARDDKPAACESKFLSALKASVDVSLLKDSMFIIFMLSNFVQYLGFFAPLSYMPDRAMEFGLTRVEAAFLVSISGIGNIIGGLVSGAVADLRLVKPFRLHLYNTYLVILGVATVVSFVETYAGQVAYAAVHGICVGSVLSMTPVVLTDLFGVERLTGTFGMVLLAQGLSTLIGLPLCGWIYDLTGSYQWVFIMSGIILAAGGMLLFAIPVILRHHGKVKKVVFS